MIRNLMLVVAALTLSACATPNTASRGLSIGGLGGSTDAARAHQPYQVSAVQIRVPETLRVSEANLYYPFADIVWRGDRIGNRYEQVKAMFETSFDMASRRLNTGRPVFVDIEVTRFHALTEKARYVTGGFHSIDFILTLIEPTTGEVIEQRQVNAGFKALGGSQAIAADARGETQKARVTSHLMRVVVQQLGTAQEIASVMPEATGALADGALDSTPN